jgi:hypothetical protein
MTDATVCLRKPHPEPPNRVELLFQIEVPPDLLAELDVPDGSRVINCQRTCAPPRPKA